MVKVTTTNVTRLSEDALYMAMEALKESDPIYVLIEAELDRRAECHERVLKARQTYELEQLQKTHKIQAEIRNIFDGYKGLKTLLLIEKLGQEFVDDYTIDEVSFTVFSSVAQFSSFDVPSSWECESYQKAAAKKARLIYYRIYDKYMREATPENLAALKLALGE